MNREQYLLNMLAEECLEVAHACHKAVRFGLNHRNPNIPDAENNEQLIHKELHDMIAIYELLVKENYIVEPETDQLDKDCDAKQIKVAKYFEISKQLGRVITPPDEDE